MMKKIIENRIFIVIITMIICISGTLYAANKYQASEVVYKASDGTTTDVNTALNNIYNKLNKFESFEFSMGEGTNLGGADGYRSVIRFDSKWFNDNVESLWIKNCASSNVNVQLFYNNSISTPYVSYITSEYLTNTTSDYKKLTLKDIDSDKYKYTWIIVTSGSSEYMAAAQIKLVFK